MNAIEALAQDRDDAATALTAATRARKDAEQVERAAQAVYDAACVEYAKVEDRPYNVGDKVKRKELRRGTYQGFGRPSTPDRTVFVRGTVALCEGVSNYRNHYPKPGEYFVLSESGQTAYSLRGEWELDA